MLDADWLKRAEELDADWLKEPLVVAFVVGLLAVKDNSSVDEFKADFDAGESLLICEGLGKEGREARGRGARGRLVGM